VQGNPENFCGKLFMKNILSLGQCSFDHAQLGRAFKDFAQIVAVADEQDAIKLLEDKSFDLILVNREFDQDGSSGIEFIRTHMPLLRGKGIPAMLVSNYPDAQALAVQAGALPGFGKAEMSPRKIAEIIDQLS
jgi:DNA-binding NarL/FixJ family response regulator